MTDVHAPAALSKPLHWTTYASTAILALACAGLFGFSALVAGHLTVETRALLTSVNLVLVVALMVVGFVKRLGWLKLPVLVLLSATGGVVVSLLADETMLVGVGMGVAFALIAVITVLVTLSLFNFQRLQLWLSVLGLAFSLWGIIMLQIDGFQPLTLLCATAAIVCLCGLLHNTIRRVQTELPSNAYITAGAGVFLLWVGLVVNTVVLLRAAGV